jgi:hypothetical protein
MEEGKTAGLLFIQVEGDLFTVAAQPGSAVNGGGYVYVDHW